MYVSLEKIHPLNQEISYIQDFDLKNRVKVTKTKSTLKVYLYYIGGNQAKGSKDIAILMKFSHILNPPVTFKMRSRSPKSQL